MKMKKERTSEEERYGNYYPLFSYNNIKNTNIMNDDFYSLNDFHAFTNNVSRVDYPRDLDDEEIKPSLLNLDSPSQRKERILGLDSGNESVDNKSFFDTVTDDEMDMDDPDSWMFKKIEDWNQRDTMKWSFHEAHRMGQLFNQMMNTLAIPGKELLQLSKQDFIERDKVFGCQLHDSLRKLHYSIKPAPLFGKLKSDDESSVVSSTNYSDGESMSSTECVKKRPPGRPRILNPKVKKAKEKLWEFVRNMLLDPRYCPALIRWVDYKSKRFCFVKSDQVAKLWGKRKQNNNMTYEKFSRAMRYYYEKRIFKAVVGRRLVYEFGDMATGWETDNPNFANTG